jgi:hypothetical protein
MHECHHSRQGADMRSLCRAVANSSRIALLVGFDERMAFESNSNEQLVSKEADDAEYNADTTDGPD